MDVAALRIASYNQHMPTHMSTNMSIHMPTHRQHARSNFVVYKSDGRTYMYRCYSPKCLHLCKVLGVCSGAAALGAALTDSELTDFQARGPIVAYI